MADNLLVRIIKNWDYPDLMRQTPGGKGIWNGIKFTEEAVDTCDYAIILNKPKKDTYCKCSQQKLWAIIQEPPTETKYDWHYGDKKYYRIYTTNENLTGGKYIHSYPALPWHINKTYDELIKEKIPDKRKTISCISSNLTKLKGHRKRLEFINDIKDKLQFDLFGKGISFIKDKWDALAPYKYSIAIENYRNKFYWTEKIFDCFLSWTIPIYFGCSNIKEYFPEESLIEIDIKKPEEAIEIIKEAILNNYWEKKMDALVYARELTLGKYNFFSFFSQEIHESEQKKQIKKKRPKRVKLTSIVRFPLKVKLSMLKSKI